MSNEANAHSQAHPDEEIGKSLSVFQRFPADPKNKIRLVVNMEVRLSFERNI